MYIGHKNTPIPIGVNHMTESNEEFQKNALEYADLLEQLGLKDQDNSKFNNRVHRRFNFNSPEKTILIQIDEDICSLYDVSIGGLSFFSRNEYPVGKPLKLNFDNRYKVATSIVNAFQDKTVSSDSEVFFRHGARFLNHKDGYMCTSAVLNYYLEIEKLKF